LGKDGSLSGKKVVVTAGGTQEPIDPVRVISNRSSGKQGYALAQAALDQGAKVVLISGPTCLTPPLGAEMIEIQTAVELAEATLRETEKADLLIMAAAVADYRPTRISIQKVKKTKAGLSAIELETTPDILQKVAERKKKSGSGPQLTVGFAAETENLLENARIKLEEKGLDLIAANDVSKVDAGIGADQNQITLIWKDGNSREVPLMDKSDLSAILIEECARLM
jgi:phosphopantothenoylcysteine decarboxylase/phosphopantothenate--cysteine ligase